jgi:hypothetical protein
MTDMTAKTGQEEKLRVAQSILNEAHHLVRLIETAADQIADTCADDRGDILRAFGHGADIRSAAGLVIEKIEEASSLLYEPVSLPITGEKAA